MTIEERNFNKAYEYALVYSRRQDVVQGVLFRDIPNNKEYFGCLGDYNTGTDPVLSPLQSLASNIKNLKKVDFSSGELYMSYAMDLPTANILGKLGVKNIFFATTSKIDPSVEKVLTDNGINYTQKQKDYVYPEKWWTDIFYDKAYDIVKERKAPFTIISYNNPIVPTLKHFGVDKMTDDLNWPIFIFVRTSQKEIYENSTKDYRYVKIIDFPDTLISNAGAVRRASQKWLYSQGYSIALQGDDDCTLLTYSRKATKGDGSPKAGYVENTNICKVLAMWQLAMEKAIERDNVYLSCSMPVGFSWKPDYCMSYDSYLLSRGSFTNIICWNLKGLVEDRIFYRDNPLVGLDDIDMEIRVIESGHNLCNFTWLVNSGDTMSSGQSMEVLQKRFKECQDKLRSFHEHLEWVHFREKRNLDQVCVYFPGVRKWQKEQGYRDTTDYIYDIWEGGELINVK